MTSKKLLVNFTRITKIKSFFFVAQSDPRLHSVSRRRHFHPLQQMTMTGCLSRKVLVSKRLQLLPSTDFHSTRTIPDLKGGINSVADTGRLGSWGNPDIIGYVGVNCCFTYKYPIISGLPQNQVCLYPPLQLGLFHCCVWIHITRYTYYLWLYSTLHHTPPPPPPPPHYILQQQ